MASVCQDCYIAASFSAFVLAELLHDVRQRLIIGQFFRVYL